MRRRQHEDTASRRSVFGYSGARYYTSRIRRDPFERVAKVRFFCLSAKKGKGGPYSIIQRRVPELIPVLGSQPVGVVSHKPGGRLPLLSAGPAVTPATLQRAATNFAAR